MELKIQGGGNAGILMARLNHGEWGYVCDDQFDQNLNAAFVSCRTLGFKGEVARHGDAEGDESIPFTLDDVECTGQETDISQCTFNYEEHNCYSSGKNLCEASRNK